MGDKIEYVSFQKIKECFNTYVLPTIESENKGHAYIIRYTKSHCDKLGLQYIEKQDDFLLEKNCFEIIENLYKNRRFYHEGKIDLYSANEVAQLLNITAGHISEHLIKDGTLNVATIVKGLSYFNKYEVDKIKEIIDNSCSMVELEAIIKQRCNQSNMGRSTIWKYAKWHFHGFVSPVNKYDHRIFKEYINPMVEYVNTNFKPKVRTQDYSIYFKNLLALGNVKYIYSDEIDSYEDYRELRGFYLNYYLSSNNGSADFRKIVNHVVTVCKAQNIIWYTNKDLNNIYISKKDVDEYLHYYNISNSIREMQGYYINTEVQQMLNVKDTSRIAKFAGYKNIGNRKYIKKDKVDELVYIKNNTIPLITLSEELDVEYRRILRAMDKLEISYIKPREVPLGNDIRIYNSEIERLRDFFDKDKQLIEVENAYEKYKLLINDIPLNNRIPSTLCAYDEFVLRRFKDNDGDYILNALVVVYKFFGEKLSKEIMNYTDDAVSKLFKYLSTKMAKREFSFFLNYCNTNYKTSYSSGFKIDIAINNPLEPYTIEQWRAFGYLLFDKNSTLFTDLLQKAVHERINAMVWLYCAMHYVCGWRANDIIGKLPSPDIDIDLEMNEIEVIECISNRRFTEEMSQVIVNDIMTKLKALGINASKTEGTNKQVLKLVVESRYVYVIGMLIALCEAHRRLFTDKKSRNHNTSVILTERATRKETHRRFYGDVYSEIFGDEGFNNIRASKTYLNYVQLMSQEKGWGIGYHLASIVRGHKLNKQGIANSTEIYLDFINKSNDVDCITYSLIDRGVFGFIPYTLLKIVYGDEFKQYSIADQNREIRELEPLNPFQIEKMVLDVTKQVERANSVIQDLLTTQKSNIKSILTKISLGEVPSKMEHSQCLLKAVERTGCIFPSRKDCIGCEYLIGEMYFLLEYKNRLFNLLDDIKTSTTEYDKKRNTHMLLSGYLPILYEAVHFMGKEGGADDFLDSLSSYTKVSSVLQWAHISK